jgi:hypothetical protein
MRVTANYLRRLIAVEIERTLSESRFLFEEEEEKGDEGDDTAEDLFGDAEEVEDDDKGGDGKSPSSDGAGGAGDGGADDEEESPEDEESADEETEEEEEEEREPPKPTGPTGFEFDEEINTAMAGFEERALDVAAAKNEGRTLSMARFLFEAEEEDEVAIDIATFADDTARLISNYDTLIDMEKAIYSKAVDFVVDKYGDDAGDELRDILSRRYGIDLEHENDPEADEFEVYAAGATSGGGAA